MGRPAVAFDLDELAKLAALQCTQKEVAGWFDCSERTVVSKLKQPRYRDVWERGRDKGRVSLRRLQFRLAERSPAMAIFLGKVILGQSDRPDDIRAEELPTDRIVIRVVGDPSPASDSDTAGRDTRSHSREP